MGRQAVTMTDALSNCCVGRACSLVSQLPEALPVEGGSEVVGRHVIQQRGGGAVLHRLTQRRLANPLGLLQRAPRLPPRPSFVCRKSLRTVTKPSASAAYIVPTTSLRCTCLVVVVMTRCPLNLLFIPDMLHPQLSH